MSDQGRVEVEHASESSESSNWLLAKWKATKPLPFNEAVLTGGQPPMGIREMIWSVLKSPTFIVGLVFVLKYLRKAPEVANTVQEGEL